MDWLTSAGDKALTQSIVSCYTRLKTSTLFDDKLSALDELEQLASEHPLEVGINALSVLCDDVLHLYFDRDDEILIKKCIDILILLLLPPEQPYDITILPRHRSTNLIYYEYNLDLLFKTNSNKINKINKKAGNRMNIFIELLSDKYNEKPDMQYNIIQILITILLYQNTSHKLQKELISHHGAMNILSQLLHSPQELIRNSGIILFVHLSKNDKSIQKLLAFDGIFERILAIIANEIDIGGDIVIDDCLYLMQNLLINNESNQKYFIEIGCVQQLKQLLSHKNMQIIHKVVNILMKITRNCGYINNAQKALGTLMQSLLEIISFNTSTEEKQQDETNIEKIKQKCLILLQIILYFNQTNVNMFINIKNIKNINTNPLLFITNLSFNVFSQYLLSEFVLKSLFSQNSKLQNILIDSFIQNKPESFGNLLQKNYIFENTNIEYNDPLRCYQINKILIYLVNNNNNSKHKFINHNNNNFIHILMNLLLKTMENKNKYDQRIQIGILLLIITICYNFKAAINMICGNDKYMQIFIKLSVLSDGNEYNRGLATYLIAICLEFSSGSIPNLFEIINKKISLNRFNSNLERLRNTFEYKKMMNVMQECKAFNMENIQSIENKKRLKIFKIFANDFDLKKNECLLLENNRMRINLFDMDFIRKFEQIYCMIDKRIIQLIPSINILNNGSNNNNNNNNNKELEREIEILKKKENEKIKEINDLNQQIIKQRENINKYNDLRQKYDALNTDHQDLLVFVGHLYDQCEKMQKQLIDFKSKNKGKQSQDVVSDANSAHGSAPP